ncbi:MAG: PIN domain-containing protein [Nitrospirota bacterium]|nr:PIN domain-containing protein [Nitrospirota bacterium]
MVLVDTSIWVSHFREGDKYLQDLLLNESVLCHPFVIGELACGHLKNREEIIALLKALPRAKTVENDEILQFIENKRLRGKGIGIIDVHLLASPIISKVQLWTDDKQLQRAADKLNILYK